MFVAVAGILHRLCSGFISRVLLQPRISARACDATILDASLSRLLRRLCRCGGLRQLRFVLLQVFAHGVVRDIASVDDAYELALVSHGNLL